MSSRHNSIQILMAMVSFLRSISLGLRSQTFNMLLTFSKDASLPACPCTVLGILLCIQAVSMTSGGTRWIQYISLEEHFLVRRTLKSIGGSWMDLWRLVVQNGRMKNSQKMY